jgi:error-prone DNA polymerase
MGYAELQVTTNYSFLRGASHPHELVEAAYNLGLKAIAVTDRNSVAGIVKAHDAAKQSSKPTTRPSRWACASSSVAGWI